MSLKPFLHQTTFPRRDPITIFGGVRTEEGHMLLKQQSEMNCRIICMSWCPLRLHSLLPYVMCVSKTGLCVFFDFDYK